MSDAAVTDLSKQALLLVNRNALENKQPVDKQLARVVTDLQAIVKELNRAPAVGLDPEWKTKDILSRVRSVVNRVPGVTGADSVPNTAAGGDKILSGATWKNDPTAAGGKGQPRETKDLFDPNA